MEDGGEETRRGEEDGGEEERRMEERKGVRKQSVCLSVQ